MAGSNLIQSEERERLASINYQQHYQQQLEKTAEIMIPLLPTMKNDGIELTKSCKGSRSAAYYIYNKYDLSARGLRIQDIRNWIRTDQAQSLYYQ